uniref:Uncharacterized protein n=1 Tax=Rhizophora mucronata TaxID=61149 RepID=A0A2P2MTF8_RHIMU
MNFKPLCAHSLLKVHFFKLIFTWTLSTILWLF